MRKLELLSPARDWQCGIEAVNHGADAVYIGAPKFGARYSAGNSVTDIEKLCLYAHRYHARVYVALNTILKDGELPEARKIIRQLHEAGIDALIIQDMGLLKEELPPVGIHASTQMDNRTVEKVSFLEKTGFSQVVLARELSLENIRQIHAKTNVKLEFFIHGALCVSYSGQCYVSQALSGRSANRGECAQYCRLPYTLADADGKVIYRDKHFLSLKDLNLSMYLNDLAEAGISSFKIEGRLKDISYVKNVTAYYRKELDKIMENKTGEWQPSSSGKTVFFFEPAPEKSFNRAFSSYFLTGDKEDITSWNTPKSIGEPVGKVISVTSRELVVNTNHELHNGDGLCYFDKEGSLTGFRANRVERNRIFPAGKINISSGTPLFRNIDQQFDQLLAKKSAERTIPVRLFFSDREGGYELEISDREGNSALLFFPSLKEPAQKIQSGQIENTLSKLGTTIFTAESVNVDLSGNYFIPASVLSEYRRQVVEKLMEKREEKRLSVKDSDKIEQGIPYPQKELTYLGNVYNKDAFSFYRTAGVNKIFPAFEVHPLADVPVMFTRYCILRSLGMCKKEKKKTATHWKEPLVLIHQHKKLEIKFDCDRCEMQLILRS